jgi:hypothetical protein
MVKANPNLNMGEIMLVYAGINLSDKTNNTM